MPADSHPNAHDDANTDLRGGGLRETVRYMIVTKRVLNAQRDREKARLCIYYHVWIYTSGPRIITICSCSCQIFMNANV